MNQTLTFDPPVQNTGLTPPATRFLCGIQNCSSDDALSGISLTTPTAPVVTSIPASMFDTGSSDIGYDKDVFSFNVVFVTLGIAGVLFTISCLATCILFRGRGNITGKWRNQPSFKLVKSKLLTQYNPYETAELPCEEKGHVFELAAGSMKSKKSNARLSSAHELSASAIEGEHGDQGAQAPQSANTIHSSETVEPRETTTLLSSESSHSRTNSVPYMLPQLPARQVPELPTE